MASQHDAFPRHDSFASRHLGPRDRDLDRMLQTLGCSSLDELTGKAIPASLRWPGDLGVPGPTSERDVLAELTALAAENKVLRSYLGMGYHGTLTPAVIQRNILENPGWYTQYTPYQAEISQGRMEALLNYQTLVLDLTGLQVANSSLLDEATAAAEAMTMLHRLQGKDSANTFFVDRNCHPQTIAVVQQRAEPLGFEVEVGDPRAATFSGRHFGVLLQYPGTDGRVEDQTPVIERAHAAGALAVVAADLLALTILKPPGEMGADVVVGSAQRFGVPLGYGGPHAAFMAAKKEFQRQLPGRIVGVSIDATGKPAMRLSLGTREQHIRREKATSNICTAQVLLAVMASMYAVYHGPDGLRAIATRIHSQAECLAHGLKQLGHRVQDGARFDTVRVWPKDGAAKTLAAALHKGINLRDFGDGSLGISLDETVEQRDLHDLVTAFGGSPLQLRTDQAPPALDGLSRSSGFLSHPTFHRFHSEHELLRYIHRLQAKDLSLTTSMIPLGSCTMKLNATTEMYPVSLAGFGGLHPFVPADQAKGYARMFERLSAWLCDITGFAGCSLQPNAGSQGEYAGLLVIRAYHRKNGQEQRNVCLIPSSAHGTNPASAAMAGMKVVVVACDDDGNIDLGDLERRAVEHKDHLAALMVTYPSTHGVFEEGIRKICKLVHAHGGQVYMDGANMNAQVGLLRPGDLGADVCHLNLHKTFCIPHGGGGPGVGPICCASHLAPFLPGHPVVKTGGQQAIGPISAAPWGSASILPISYAYIAMMGPEGLRRATQVAIANANYVAKRLTGHFPVLYTGQNGMVAHECIVDVRQLKAASGVEVGDIAKRLMDYGFHAPTISFPVAGTMMIEPTESESKAELDRFCDALIAIRDEIREIEQGKADKVDNLLKNAPHTAAAVTAAEWKHPYSRERAAFPAAWTKEHKFWPPIARINDVHGDRNLVCACPPVAAYA
ncbi:MAG: aminomethyl-transferring glycine dehydrogenase [Planctomycetes bacterium]|nr:aminomethyl-transferring glycine dehydrogenase [Planctomycetota bacterium]MCC7396245.1 aminomethyl-transferring glycine dehydrogenase [Planctomycetota bacterium]